MSPDAVYKFQETLWDYFHAHGRDLPWRHEPFDPYNILVSEIMLQQTQVARVIPKYEEFLKLFPTTQALAEATLADVLIAWSGLGYNRRAKYLHEAAKQLSGLAGRWSLDDLTSCKGIGHNTAAAVVTYTYNLPIPFIETNVRTVLIHHFFADQEGISDKQLMELMEEVLDKEHPREFMWAMMDYGSYLKTAVGNLSQKSKTYTKQSKFEGSARQVRGEVLRQLADGPLSLQVLQERVGDARLPAVLASLISDGLIEHCDGDYSLAK